MNPARAPRHPVAIDKETVHIGTANELMVALDVLQGRHDREALEQLRPHLADILADAEGFISVIKSLSPADQTFLIESVGTRLAGIMEDAAHLRDLLAAMADVEVEETLLQTLGRAGLRALIHTPEELAGALEWVYGQCDRLFLELLGPDHVRRLCRQAGDLSAVLRRLEPALQESLLEGLGWERVAGMPRDAHDLAALLRALPPAAGKRLLAEFTRERLADLIANPDDWEYLYRRLEPDEADAVVRLLGIEPRA
ncbi:MAG: hypothetical protein NTW86_10380 [Candidatus Sumerlaeota bacterium]|nr:hypothetical protein [Candidatus Sumerlaeota bacterium]